MIHTYLAKIRINKALDFKKMKTDVALSIEADCKKVEEHLTYLEQIALDRDTIQHQFDSGTQRLDKLHEKHEWELDEVLKHLHKDNNNATLKYHGASAEVRALVDKIRYVPKHKSLPLEERLDAMERSIAKLADEVSGIGRCVSMSMAK